MLVICFVVVVVLLREATAVCMTIHVRSRGVAFLAESQLCVCSWEDDINSVGVKEGWGGCGGGRGVQVQASVSVQA